MRFDWNVNDIPSERACKHCRVALSAFYGSAAVLLSRRAPVPSESCKFQFYRGCVLCTYAMAARYAENTVKLWWLFGEP